VTDDRVRLAGGGLREEPDPPAGGGLPDARLARQAFLAAARDGDFDALVAVLDADIVERVDTGSGTIVEVRGAQNVARRAMAASQLGLLGRPALINGAAGWISVLDASSSVEPFDGAHRAQTQEKLQVLENPKIP
jgi:hypothetical protein